MENYDVIHLMGGVVFEQRDQVGIKNVPCLGLIITYRRGAESVREIIILESLDVLVCPDSVFA